jgi:hypothetical protein
MKTVRTLDRTLALKCKEARTNGEEITVRYETPGGWNVVTGVIQSVQRRQARQFKPFWEITIVEPRGEAAARPAITEEADGSWGPVNRRPG